MSQLTPRETVRDELMRRGCNKDLADHILTILRDRIETWVRQEQPVSAVFQRTFNEASALGLLAQVQTPEPRRPFTMGGMSQSTYATSGWQEMPTQVRPTARPDLALAVRQACDIFTALVAPSARFAAMLNYLPQGSAINEVDLIQVWVGGAAAREDIVLVSRWAGRTLAIVLRNAVLLRAPYENLRLRIRDGLDEVGIHHEQAHGFCAEAAETIVHLGAHGSPRSGVYAYAAGILTWGSNLPAMPVGSDEACAWMATSDGTMLVGLYVPAHIQRLVDNPLAAQPVTVNARFYSGVEETTGGGAPAGIADDEEDEDEDDDDDDDDGDDGEDLPYDDEEDDEPTAAVEPPSAVVHAPILDPLTVSQHVQTAENLRVSFNRISDAFRELLGRPSAYNAEVGVPIQIATEEPTTPTQPASEEETQF